MKANFKINNIMYKLCVYAPHIVGLYTVYIIYGTQQQQQRQRNDNFNDNHRYNNKTKWKK